MTEIVGIEAGSGSLFILMNNGARYPATRINNAYWQTNIHLSGEGGNTPQPNPDPGGGSGGSSGGEYSITPEMIRAGLASQGGNEAYMVGSAESISASFNNSIAATMPDVLSSKARAACLAGECMQETDYFKTTEEYAKNGPYAPYYGRGFIQLTWRDNYAKFGQWCHGLGMVDDPNVFVNNPAQVAELQWAPYTALFYFTQNSWAGKNLFEWCDSVNSPWYEISAAINYGNPTSGFVGGSYNLRGQIIDAMIAVM